MLPETGERLHEELLVRHGLADLERRVPGRQHRQVVVVELVDRLRVVRLELVLGDLVDPRADDLAEELTTRLTTDRLRDHADCFLWFDEAEGHREPLSPLRLRGRTAVEGTRGGGRKNRPWRGLRAGRPVEVRKERGKRCAATRARSRAARPG